MTDNKSLKIVTIGFYVGSDYFIEHSKLDPAPQVAAFKLEERLIEAIEIFCERIDVISSIAVQTYPKNPKILFPKSSFSLLRGAGHVIPLLNLPGLKLVSRFLGVARCLLRLPQRPDALVVYAAHTPNLLTSYLYSRLFKTPYFVYVPDLPIYMDGPMVRSKLIKFLKRFDSRIIDFLIKKSDGVIAITKYMITDNPAWQGLPFIVLEGIASVDEVSTTEESPLCSPVVTLYAGGLSEEYGVKQLIEGYLKAEVTGELWICGKGELENYIKSTAAEHANIKYLGFLPAAEISALQQKAKFLAITRDPNLTFTRYSFPSKILEYLASGIPTVSTRIDGIPDEYYSHLNIIDTYDIQSIALTLRTLHATDYSALKLKAINAQHWLREEKSIQNASRKLKLLINP